MKEESERVQYLIKYWSHLQLAREYDKLESNWKQLKKEYDKALEILCEYNMPCEIDGFMDKNTDYCSINCGVDEEVFKECWKRYIKQELESGNNE